MVLRVPRDLRGGGGGGEEVGGREVEDAQGGVGGADGGVRGGDGGAVVFPAADEEWRRRESH